MTDGTLYGRCSQLRAAIRRREAQDRGTSAIRQELHWLEELRRRQLEDVRGVRLVALPPHPADEAAEERILGAVLAGAAVAGELGLRPRDFSGRLRQFAWAAILAIGELPAELRRRAHHLVQGLEIPRADAVAAVMLRLRVHHAVTGRELWEWLDWLRRSSARGEWGRWNWEGWVLRLSRQRQLLAAMSRIDAALRAGEEPDPRLVRAAVRRLGELDSRNNGC